MDTRYGKRGGKAEENNEANPELLQAVEEDLAQEFEEVPIQPKKRKQMPPKKTRALELAKLKEQTKMDRQKIEHLEERINYLEEANRDLKADKDFLLAQIKKAPSTPASSGKDCSGTIFIFDFNIDISMSLLRLQLLIILRRRGEEKQKEEVQEKDQEVKTP
ncbi:unnamed protein product [Merluccius merluccius]